MEWAGTGTTRETGDAVLVVAVGRYREDALAEL